MSYVVEAAIGIENKGATATRGWFRIDPAQCRVVAPGDISAERLFLHARALPVYGASPAAQNGQHQLCVASGEFLIAAARNCRRGEQPAPFAEIKPSKAEDGTLTAYLAESSEYDDDEARLAAIQRLLLIAGFDVAPIDGVDGPKTQAALAKFLKERNLPADTLKAADAFDRLIAAVQRPGAGGLSWCNETPHRILAALGLDDGKAVTTRGWYSIEPGKCTNADLAGQAQRLFSFAEAVDAEGRAIEVNGKPVRWGGETMLCTRDSKFEVADQTDCAARGLTASGFAAVPVEASGKTLQLRMPR